MPEEIHKNLKAHPVYYGEYINETSGEIEWETFCGYENPSDFIICFYDYRGKPVGFTLDECRRLHEDLQAHMNLNEG